MVFVRVVVLFRRVDVELIDLNWVFYSRFVSRGRVPLIFLSLQLPSNAVIPIPGGIQLNFFVVEDNCMQLILVDGRLHILLILRRLLLKHFSYFYYIFLHVLGHLFVPFLSWLFLSGNHCRIVVWPLCCFQVQRIVEVTLQFFAFFGFLLGSVEPVGVLKSDSDVVKRGAFFEEKRIILRMFFDEFVR